MVGVLNEMLCTYCVWGQEGGHTNQTEMRGRCLTFLLLLWQNTWTKTT